MDQAVRRFARKILLIHLALLLVLLAVVVYAAGAIEYRAREQALAQAQQRQELLTSQTARGIENFYRGIIEDMDLLPTGGPEDDARLPVLIGPTTRRSRSTTRPGAFSGAAAAQRSNAFGVLLGRQLGERASHLFILDLSRMTVVRSLLAREADNEPNARQIVEAYEPWLKEVKAPTISTFKIVGNEGLNLVCRPMPQNRLAVAVIPVETINEEYILSLNQDQSTAAYLVDHSVNIMAASRPSLVGVNLAEAGDENVKRLAAAYQSRPAGLSTVFKKGSTIGSETFPPALITASMIDVVPGRPWSIVIASPLSEVDRIVASLFDRIFLGAAGVTLAITAILFSTGVQMVRGRMRLERMQREVLERELKQAHDIQLAWLPGKRIVHPSIDLAAVNQPASHISGDFYNWFELDDGRVAVVIGDVTGHGIAAAFLMATTQLLVRNTLPTAASPGACMEQVNRHLCVQMFNGQFVTMQILVFDPQRGQVEIATAGHPPPLMCTGCITDAEPSADPSVFRPLPLDPQLVLGVESDTQYPTETFDLPAGASLLLYTDGVTDLEGEAGQRLYGAGLQRQLHRDRRDSERQQTANELLDAVVQSLTRYRGTRDLGDDLTIVAVRFQPIRGTGFQPVSSVMSRGNEVRN